MVPPITEPTMIPVFDEELDRESPPVDVGFALDELSVLVGLSWASLLNEALVICDSDVKRTYV